MPTALFRSLFLLGPFCLMLGAQAQVDTTAIGGPDSGEDEFLMLDPDHVDAHADIEEAAHALGLMWDVNDSLSLIPCTISTATGTPISCSCTTDRPCPWATTR